MKQFQHYPSFCQVFQSQNLEPTPQFLVLFAQGTVHIQNCSQFVIVSVLVGGSFWEYVLSRVSNGMMWQVSQTGTKVDE